MSRLVTPELALQADFLVAMTHGHLMLLADSFPRLGGGLRLLSPDGTDVPDPIGSDQGVYRACAEQIRDYLEKLVLEVQPS